MTNKYIVYYVIFIILYYSSFFYIFINRNYIYIKNSSNLKLIEIIRIIYKGKFFIFIIYFNFFIFELSNI
jgi:hypothetical protein